MTCVTQKKSFYDTGSCPIWPTLETVFTKMGLDYEDRTRLLHKELSLDEIITQRSITWPDYYTAREGCKHLGIVEGEHISPLLLYHY